MTKELHDLETYEVSLVPKGANGKQFLVFKNLTGESGMKTAQELVDAVTKNVNPKVMQEVQQILKDAESGSAPMSDKAQAALQAIARIASPMKDEIHPAMLHKVLCSAGFDMSKAMDVFGNPDGGAHGPDGEPPHSLHDSSEPLEKDHMKAIPEEILSDMKDVLKSKMNKSDDSDDDEDDSDEIGKAIRGHMDEAMESAKKAYGEHLQKLGYRKYPDAEMRMKSLARKDLKQVDVSEEAHEHGEAQSMDKNVLKSLDLSKVDPKVKTALETLFKQSEGAVAKAAKLETELKTEREARREKEFIEKAAKLNVGAETSELAKILKAIDDVNPELSGKVAGVLRAAGEQISKGNLFSEIGSGAGGDLPGTDAYAKIEAIAKGMVEKSATKITHAEAIEAVLKTEEGKRLYNEYMAAKPGMKV